MNGWPEATTGIIGAAIGALVAWLLGRRKAEAEPVKMHAEATEAITDSAVSMLDRMQREIDRLAGRVTCLEREVAAYRAQIACLEEKLTKAEGEIENLTEERDELLRRVQRLENGTTVPPHVHQGAQEAHTGESSGETHHPMEPPIFTLTTAPGASGAEDE